MNVDKFTKYGLIRVVDGLGRIVIPVALRRKYGIETADELEIIDTPDGILVRKFVEGEEDK